METRQSGPFCTVLALMEMGHKNPSSDLLLLLFLVLNGSLTSVSCGYNEVTIISV